MIKQTGFLEKFLKRLNKIDQASLEKYVLNLTKEKDFDLSNLLHMDQETYQTKVWPHMFYMPFDEMWRWKMNVARAMGNSVDITLILDPPHNKHTRLIIGIADSEDYSIDKSYSQWFDT